jgi:hypothetical protein
VAVVKFETAPGAICQLCTALCCLLFMMITVASAASPDLQELEIDHALTFDFQTPHTKWAKPYAGGKTRVLFFTDGTGTDPRECVELMQRFEIEARAVFWANIGDTDRKSWHGGQLGERRMLDLLQQRWDCFVFLGLELSKVPPEPRSLIEQAVNRGAGIVLVGTSDKMLLQEKLRLPQLPDFVAGEQAVGAYRVGKGRGISLLSRPKLDYREGWQIDYDYLQESLGRAVLWSAGKVPATRLDLALAPAGSPPGRQVVLPAGKSAALSAKLSGKPLGKNLRLSAVLRLPGHRNVTLPERDIVPGADISLAVPALPAGSWHADARVIGSLGVESWASSRFEVHSGRQVSGVKLDGNWSEPGGAIAGKVVVSGDRLPGEVLRVQLLDRRRRELARQDLPVAGEATAFSFAMPKWLPMLVTVEAKLLAGGREISSSYQYFHVTQRKQGQFNFLIWGLPKGTLASYAEESLARQGVTLQLDWENPPLQVAAFDISWVPFTTQLYPDKTPAGIMKPFCWNDLPSVRKQSDMLANIHRPSREHGTFVYSIGDENKTLGSCLSPYCATAYRDFLQESYGSLEALNKSWQTKFKNWREVGLAQPGDDDEAASKRAKNYPRWFDRQAYKSWNYVHYCQKYAQSFRAVDPGARTGFDGAVGFATGDDLDLIVRSIDSWVPYSNIVEEVVRSIAPRKFIRSDWVGGRFKTAGPLLHSYWRLVTLGADSVWWWMWSCIGDLHGFLAPDLRPFPEIAEVVMDTRVVRDGLGHLLLHSTMQSDAVGILYSYPSVFAGKLEEGGTYGGYEEAHAELIKSIRSAGLQFRYLTDRMLRQGEVDLSQYKILFLPRAEALGDREASAIRSFVAKGGTVVADFRPGLYDDHCKRRSAGVLDDLFGIRRVSAAASRTLRTGQGADARKTPADPGVVLSGARAGRTVDGIPLWMSHQVGKGRSMLLNSRMDNFPAVELAGLAKGGFPVIAPVYQVTGADGKMAHDVAVTRWLDGGIEIVSLLRKDGAQEELTLSFPSTKYAYDLRGRKHTGPVKSLVTTFLPNRANFFVLTDRPEPGLSLALDVPALQPGKTAIATFAVPGATGLHPVKLSVYAGSRHLDWQDRTLLVGDAAVTLEIPVAYNDPTGEYRVVASDLLNGEKYSAVLNVDRAAPTVSGQAD